VVPLRKFHQLISSAWSGAAATYSAIMPPSWRFFALFDAESDCAAGRGRPAGRVRADVQYSSFGLR